MICCFFLVPTVLIVSRFGQKRLLNALNVNVSCSQHSEHITPSWSRATTVTSHPASHSHIVLKNVPKIPMCATDPPTCVNTLCFSQISGDGFCSRCLLLSPKRPQMGQIGPETATKISLSLWDSNTNKH